MTHTTRKPPYAAITGKVGGGMEVTTFEYRADARAHCELAIESGKADSAVLWDGYQPLEWFGAGS